MVCLSCCLKSVIGITPNGADDENMGVENVTLRRIINGGLKTGGATVAAGDVSGRRRKGRRGDEIDETDGVGMGM